MSLGSEAGGRRKPKIEKFFWICTFTKLLQSLLRYAFNFQQKCFLGLHEKKISSINIEVRFCFDGFVEGNSMVQSDFNFEAQG